MSEQSKSDEQIDVECLAAAMSGEMGNMFVVMRRHNITSKEYSSRVQKVKSDPRLRILAKEHNEKARVIWNACVKWLSNSRPPSPDSKPSLPN